MGNNIYLNRSTPKIFQNAKLSVIIPVYNEKENIEEVVRRTEKTLGNNTFELVIVDDNSPDGTGKIVKQLNEVYGNLKLMHRSNTLGLSSAILAGFERSNRGSHIFAVMDADLQHPPELLFKMYREILKGNDLVIASRYVTGGGISAWSLRRKIISRLANLVAHVLLPETRIISDTMSGYFMIKRSVLANTKFKSVGYKILIAILVKGNYNNLSEIPFLFEPRKNGRSNLKMEEIKNHILDIMTLLIASFGHR